MKGKRRRFTAEFKEESVRLLAASGELVSQVPRSLGVHDNLLRRWRQQLSDGKAATMTESGELHFATFPWRSISQALCKNPTRWVGYK